MQQELLLWYKQYGRHDLPWRTTRDPYKVLVSELMLQQTQVPRVIPKYKAFIEKWPTLQTLAAADRADVLRMWQGLGYNSRAVRLHALAKTVDILPETQEELLQLPGIGPYTAGAVMIFAHDTQADSIDVNVLRVIRRIHWNQEEIPEKKEVEYVARKLIMSVQSPHDWQSMLMDFGSAVCMTKPDCQNCPVQNNCKSQGARKDEKKQRQSKFKYSNRWYRGNILKALLKEPHTEEALTRAFDDEQEKVIQALKQLQKEGVVLEKSGRFFVQ